MRKDRENRAHAEALFDRWIDDLRISEFEGTEGLEIKMEARVSAKFGAWIICDGTSQPLIRITTETVNKLRSLCMALSLDDGFMLADDLFDHDSGSPDQRREWTGWLLYEIAFQWLMCHELSHWLLGHPEFLHRGSNQVSPESAFSEVSHGAADNSVNDEVDPIENCCIELQADSFALELLDHMHSEPALSPCSIFHRAGAPLIDLDNRFRNLRALVVASGLVMLHFDTLRNSEAYPKPATRVFNLLKMSFAVANRDAIQTDDGAPYLRGSDPKTLESVERSGRETIAHAGVDLSAASRVVGTEMTFVHYDEESSPTLRDLLRTSGLKKGAPETEGATEFVNFENLFLSKIRTKWRPFAKVDAWR